MDRDIKAAHQDKDIIKEVQELNQIIKDPNYQTYSKTTYWHQQSVDTENMNQEIFLKEITEILVRIEDKLVQIESLLKK